MDECVFPPEILISIAVYCRIREFNILLFSCKQLYSVIIGSNINWRELLADYEVYEKIIPGINNISLLVDCKMLNNQIQGRYWEYYIVHNDDEIKSIPKTIGYYVDNKKHGKFMEYACCNRCIDMDIHMETCLIHISYYNNGKLNGYFTTYLCKSDRTCILTRTRYNTGERSGDHYTYNGMPYPLECTYYEDDYEWWSNYYSHIGVEYPDNYIIRHRGIPYPIGEYTIHVSYTSDSDNIYETRMYYRNYLVYDINGILIHKTCTYDVGLENNEDDFLLYKTIIQKHYSITEEYKIEKEGDILRYISICNDDIFVKEINLRYFKYSGDDNYDEGSDEYSDDEYREGITGSDHNELIDNISCRHWIYMNDRNGSIYRVYLSIYYGAYKVDMYDDLDIDPDTRYD